jgi:acetyl esterase
MLLYPVTDYHTPGTPSYAENAAGYGLTRATMEWFWAHYLTDAGEAAHPHASPLRATDLGRLPPAYVSSAEFDPLRDEAELYGRRLREAGVPAEITRFPGMNHGFLFWVGAVAGADAAMAEACAWARQIFGAVR